MIPIVTINHKGSKDTNELIQSIFESHESVHLIIINTFNIIQNEDLNNIITFARDRFGKDFYDVAVDSNFIDKCKSVYESKLTDSFKITLINIKGNYGFSRSTNIGLKYADLDDPIYSVILNNDTIVTENFLTEIIDQMKANDKLQAAMGTILYHGYTDNIIWSIGGYINKIKATGIHVKKNRKFEIVNSNLVERKFISGCFTVFKHSSLKKIGYLDERYFFGTEEFQYSVDLSRFGKLGWVPKSIIFHKSKLELGNGSSHDIIDYKWQYNSYINKVVFANKNYKIYMRITWRIIFLLYLYIFLPIKNNRQYDGSLKNNAKLHINNLRRELRRNISSTSFYMEDFNEIEKIFI
jgi:hypothetical protein